MRLTKTDRYGHLYTNEANCRNVYTEDGTKLEGTYFANKTLAIDGNAIDKLGRLEDIEELCIKMKTQPIYVVRYSTKICEVNDFKGGNSAYDFENNCIIVYTENRERILYISNYGKTWALDKSDLMKDKITEKIENKWSRIKICEPKEFKEN